MALLGQLAALTIVLVLLLMRVQDGALMFATLPAILLSIVVAVSGVGLLAYGFLRHRRSRHSQTLMVVNRAFSKPNRGDVSVDLATQLRILDWYQFEKAVALAYQKLGYDVTRRGGANADGGIDLILKREGKKTAVQCKHWQKWKVGIKTVRELLGAMTAEGIENAILVTMRGYTHDARRFAAQHGIDLVDKTGLISLLASASILNDREFLHLLNNKRKFCPKCESQMILRTAMKGRHKGSLFWGCSAFPECRFTLTARDHQQREL